MKNRKMKERKEPRGRRETKEHQGIGDRQEIKEQEESGGSPETEEQEESGGSPESEEQKESGGSPETEEQKESGGSPETEEQKQSGGSPETEEQKQSGGSPETKEQKESGGSPETKEQKKSGGSPETGEQEESGGSRETKGQKAAVGRREAGHLQEAGSSRKLRESQEAEDKTQKMDWKVFLAQTAIVAAGTMGMWVSGGLKGQPADRLLGNCVMMLLTLLVVCFHLSREYVQGRFDYDNGEHIFRFLLCTGLGMAVALACGFLPVGGWPFLPVFIMLSLFSNMSVGLLSATSLLLISVLLNGCDAGGFALYFVSGIFAVTLFRHLGEEVRMGIPIFLSILCLLVCETANVVLVANARPDLEIFVIPVSNMIVSTVLLLGCLKIFSSLVVYKHREKYLDTIDSENPVIARMRERDKEEYMHCVHATYFCERIGKRLGLRMEALKSAGYYYRLGGELTQMLEDEQFPPSAVEILLDYRNRDQGMKKKETAVLYCSDTVVSGVKEAIRDMGRGQVDFDRLIDDIFAKLYEDKIFDKCDIALGELRAMQQIFKEEKLYYDFLR